MPGAGIVVLGAGECGARAAFALRENGYHGKVTLIGSEHHLPYERPPLSKATLVDDPSHKFIATAERYQDENIVVLLGTTVKAIDPTAHSLILDDDTTLSFEKLLLATGAQPRTLPGTHPSRRIRTLRSFDDAISIRQNLGTGRSVAIIGAGFIGLELAATARKMNTAVTVIETQPRVLMRGVPAEIAKVIASRHIKEGVDLRCGVGITSVVEGPSGVGITLSDDLRIDADMVLVGIGAVPNVALAEAAGITIGNGIAVNEELETSAPDVYAAGDCCSFPLALYGGRRVRLEAWRNAQDQGNLAARNMLGNHDQIAAVPYFWSDQYDLTLQVYGLMEGATQQVRRETSDEDFILFHLDESGRLIAASGIGRGNGIAKDMRVSEMLIAAGAKPDQTLLAEPTQKLKALLAM